MITSINKFFTQYALKLPRYVKRSLAICLDSILCFMATWIALSLRLEEFVIINWQFAVPAFIAVGIAIPIFYSLGLYNTIFRYSSTDAIRVLIKAVAIYGLLYSFIFIILTIQGIPRSIGIMQPMIMFLQVGTSRWLIKKWLGQHFRGNMNEIAIMKKK